MPLEAAGNAGNAEVVQSVSAPANPVVEALPPETPSSDAPAGTPVAP